MTRLLVLALLVLLAPGVRADDLLSGAAAGQVLFQTYCASCHGVLADGSGPVAEALKTPPSDLTRLAERYGSPLPRERLADFIDGRREVAAHGTREMPVWGERFFRSSRGEPGNVEGAKRRTLEVILQFLESIQQQRAG